MRLSGLTLALNEACNFHCEYCYKARARSSARLNFGRARSALAFFWPYLSRDFRLGFAGGEPLLSYEVLARVVGFARERARATGRRVRFALTTNGSLLDEEVIALLARNRFAVTLSFDVLAQEGQRRAGSFRETLDRLTALREEPGISLGVNSVFTAGNIGLLGGSLDLLMRWGVPRITFSASAFEPWDETALGRFEAEMVKLRGLALRHYRATGLIPIELFAEGGSKGIFACAGGTDWLSLSTDGRLWGCPLFADLNRLRGGRRGVRSFCFGSLSRFRRDPEAIYRRRLSPYLALSQDNFSSPDGPCFLCPEVESCSVCPAAAALSGSPIGFVPGYLCRMQKAKNREARKFRQAARSTARARPS